MAREFRKRGVHSGWVGERSAAQPAEGDRLRSIVAGDAITSLGHPELITRIEHRNGAAHYFLASGTTIVALTGAQIFWEEQ